MSPREKIRLIFLAVAGDANARSLLRWRLSNPDHLLYDHPLEGGGLVYDVGGYRGDWTAGMLARHDCEYHVFEPHPEAFAGLRTRFAGNPAVHLHQFALGRGSGMVSLSSDEEGSSIVAERGGASLEVRLVDARAHLERDGRRVDLMKLNIEGAEFDLLEELLWSASGEQVDALLVQFHQGAPDALPRYRRIAEKLARTHDCVWRYPFLWELWRRRPR